MNDSLHQSNELTDLQPTLKAVDPFDGTAATLILISVIEDYIHNIKPVDWGQLAKNPAGRA